MYLQGVAPKTALAAAAKSVDATISAYNQRLGD
jgi:hypothetical protein